MDQDLGVREGETLARGARAEQELAHRGGEAHRDRHHVVLDELHGVVDRHAGRDRAAGAVDVEVDVLVGVRSGKEQQLCGDLVSDVVVDRLAEEDDPLVEQPVVDLVAEATTDGRLAGGGGHQIRHVSTCSSYDGAGPSHVSLRVPCGAGAVGDFPALVVMDPNALVPSENPGKRGVRRGRSAPGAGRRPVRRDGPPGNTSPRGPVLRPARCRGLSPRSSPRPRPGRPRRRPRRLRQGPRPSRPRRPPGRRPRRWCP